MRNAYLFLLICMTLGLVSSCTTPAKKEMKIYNEGINIVPKPLELTQKEGSFTINDKTKIIVLSPELKQIAENFVKKISTSTGYQLAVVEDQQSQSNAIVVSLDKIDQLNNEGYLLESSTEGVTVKGNTREGVFYGLQTILQLLPAEIESASVVKDVAWEVPFVSIKDEPRFKWRGVHIDICRHFFPVEYIKKQIDALAMFKINTIHLHLTDDQGWRIEIKKYPELTKAGATRTEFDGSEYGGFLTQEDIKDIVAYAQEHCITIVPEIELPGHAMAALTAYPNLGCTGGPYQVRTVWGIEDEVFCAGKDETFTFLEDVINEVVPLFPGEYFHIGGDECPKGRWNACPHCKNRMKAEKLKDAHELQSYFIKRIEKTVEANGKKMIGWDEILEGGLAPSATVMSWRGEEGGIAAANMGHDVVMTPGDWMYFDKYQSDPKVEPVTIGGYAILEKVYGYDPIPSELPQDKHKHILGAQCNNWSEYMYSSDLAEYRLYPRLLALAEVTWTKKDQKDYKDFEKRLNNQLVRLDEHKINYHIPMPEQPYGSCNHVAFVDQVDVTFKTVRPEKMVYTLDGTDPDTSSAVYENPLPFTESGIIKIRTVLPTGVMSPVRMIIVEKQAYAPAITEEKTATGLEAKISNGRFLSVTDLEKNEKWETKNIKGISDMPTIPGYGPVEEKYFYGAIMTGYVNIPEDGVYYFTTENDQFWIDNKLLISNENETKRFSRNDKSVALAKGLHPIKIVYLSNIVGGWPSAWEHPFVSYREAKQTEFTKISDEMLFRN